VLDEGQHAACVDLWLERSAKDLSPAALLRLFKAAFDRLWVRTKTTLGEVTLVAIAERVLHNASEKVPFLSALKVDADGGLQFRALDERIRYVDGAALRGAIRFVLTEFLTVLGNLTAELLTPELHAELSNVAVAETALGETKTRDDDRERIERNEGKR
jgi:hypothetical protein